MEDFLALLRAGVTGNINSQLIRITDWESIYRLATQQGVQAIVLDGYKFYYEKFQLDAPANFKINLYAATLQIESRNMTVNRVLHKITVSLNRARIRFVLLKGQGLGLLYNNPNHRLSGDIDIYVGENGYAAAKTLFQNNGWISADNYHEDYNHLAFIFEGVSIELHYYTTTIPGIKRNNRYQIMTTDALESTFTGFFINDTDELNREYGDFVATFPVVENSVYVFIHLFRHFLGNGISMRQLIDWMLLLDKLNKDDFEKVKRYLVKFGFLDCWQVFGSVLVRLFNYSPDKIPCYNKECIIKADKVIKQIFKDGDNSDVGGGHAKDMRSRIKIAVDHLYNIKRTLCLFPKETFSFLGRFVANVSIKYLHLYNH